MQDKNEKPEVIIFSDGSAKPNPGAGGWAAILLYENREKVLTGSSPHATNNQMELQAAISALEALKRPCRVELFTDSEYLRNGITQWITGWAAKGWRLSNGKPVKNVNLWKQLWELSKKHEISWHWVQGHTGNHNNERVDRLAAQARQKEGAS